LHKFLKLTQNNICDIIKGQSDIFLYIRILSLLYKLNVIPYISCLCYINVRQHSLQRNT
jgi:hypothetical protein